jgi:hypothetical protein
MSYVTDEEVQAAIEDAQRAQSALQQVPPEQRRVARDRADDLQERAQTLRIMREGIEHRQAERAETIAQMQSALKRDKAALDRSTQSLSALAQELAADLARLQKATANHAQLIQDANHRLSAQGLHAADDTTPQGSHHKSGSNGHHGVYLQDVLYRPLDPIAITLAVAAQILGNMGGTSDLRNLHQLGQVARQNGHLDTRTDGFALPAAIQTAHQTATTHTNGTPVSAA